jgi:hypothetical protein
MFKVAKHPDLTLNEGWAYDKGGGSKWDGIWYNRHSFLLKGDLFGVQTWIQEPLMCFLSPHAIYIFLNSTFNTIFKLK